MPKLCYHADFTSVEGVGGSNDRPVFRSTTKRSLYVAEGGSNPVPSIVSCVTR
jgi:hypothetical protein